MNTGNARRVFLFDFTPQADQFKLHLGQLILREKQEGLWIAHTELVSALGHPFYQRLNELLDAEHFDQVVPGRECMPRRSDTVEEDPIRIRYR